MLTKAELEDIWNNKPYGYIKTINKKLKKSKKFSVSLQPITYTYHEKYTTEVVALNETDAYQEAKSEYIKKYPEININAWNLFGAERI